MKKKKIGDHFYVSTICYLNKYLQFWVIFV